jgi:hypothetical protein
MLLNETNSLIQIRKLLDDPEVYKYEDGAETAEKQFEDDIVTISDEVYLSEMLTIISAAQYESIKAADFSSYTANQKRLFYAECYFVASKFLIAYSLRNETEMYKSTLDFNSKTVGVEKSGKLFTAEEYARTAKDNIAEFEREYYSVDADSYYGRNKRSSISIGRY